MSFNKPVPTDLTLSLALLLRFLCRAGVCPWHHLRCLVLMFIQRRDANIRLLLCYGRSLLSWCRRQLCNRRNQLSRVLTIPICVLDDIACLLVGCWLCDHWFVSVYSMISASDIRDQVSWHGVSCPITAVCLLRIVNRGEATWVGV